MAVASASGTAADGSAPRVVAARAVLAVDGGASLDAALPGLIARLAPADRSLAQALAYGVLRERRLLDTLLDRLLRDPAQTAPPLRALLRVGLQQLRASRVPAHAAVAATVAASAELGLDGARGVVNAVLRRFQREARQLEAALPDFPGVRLSYPDWMVRAVLRDWPASADAVLRAGNQQAPMTLRVNRRRLDPATASRHLQQAGLAHAPVTGVNDALQLEQACAVEAIPGFGEGLFSVQDASAQLAAPLLAARPGMRVLDACAAPGGKSAHLLETVDGLDLTALEVDPARLERLRATLTRLGLPARPVHGDALTPESWWDGTPYQRILLDAPCSGSGVIRRHPDIKWLRRREDIPVLARRQRQMLEALWPLLAPGGLLLYATCSIHAEEGVGVIRDFLADHPDARAQPLALTTGEAAPIGWRLPPGGAFDGFYYCRLRRTPPSPTI